MGGFKVLKNSVQLQLESEKLSRKDKMTKNESKADFLNKISTDFVCIFQIFRFLVKLKPNEKAL